MRHLMQHAPTNGMLGGALLLVTQHAAIRYLGASSMHKNLFPLDGADVLGISLAAAALFVAAGGGIGGGALLVPVLLTVLNFHPNNAVALSNVTIVGGAIANFLFNFRRRHPSGDKPLVDWDLILVMEPTTILGALAGSYFNKVLPGWVTTVLLALLLLFLASKLVVRGVRTYRAETAEHKAGTADQAAAADGDGDPNAHAGSAVTVLTKSAARQMDRMASFSVSEHTTLFEDLHDRAAHAAESVLETAAELAAPLLGRGGGNGHSAAEDGAAEQAPAAAVEQQAELERILEGERRQLPWQHISALVALTLAVIASDASKEYVRCGSAAYWAIALSLVPITGAVSAVAARWLTRKYNTKLAAGRSLRKGEVAWTRRNTIVYPAVCSLAGLVAGMFGVGGGIVKGPLMLEMGVLPDVAAATSATMIMFTSASASAVYIGFGTVKADYGIAMFIVGFVVTLAGQAAATWLMQRLQRRSVIVFCMAALMSLAAVVMTAESVFRTVSSAKHHELGDWGGIC